MRVTLIAPVFVSAFYSYISFLANIEKLLAVGVKKTGRAVKFTKAGCKVCQMAKVNLQKGVLLVLSC